eukprot:TRINITY_DN4735_c0_g1_i2.p2 TRINITY_DN4735_c0_g1~~TRINITY_DN4735_c0_g1_i2.p2  ORF type:complete len:131 (-),score=31.19 TRINITY_DN4735_c0_g1_i2:150-542(-)
MSKITAIEIVPQLHDLAVELLHHNNNDDNDDNEMAMMMEQVSKIDLLRGDMFDPTMVEIWKSHSILFVSTTCFTPSMLVQLSDLMEQFTSPGSRVITLSIPLRSAKFKLVSSNKYRMSWGNATVFVQVKQ